MLADLLQILVGGLLLGGLYAIAAFGLSISFGVLNVLNVAHGDFLMLGSLASYGIFTWLGVSPFVAAAIVLPFFFLAGVGFERLLVRPIAAKPHMELLIASILVTLGASLTISDITSYTIGPSIKGIAYSLPPLTLGGVVISSLRLAVLGIIALIALALHAYLTWSYAGRAMRAITQDREGAMIVGVNVSAMSMRAFGLGIALAGAAGAFYATLYTVSPFIGIPLTIKYLVVVVLGGLGSLLGTVVGAVVLGVAETLVGFYLGADWTPTVAVGILIVVLLLRPAGLLGRAAERV